MTTLKQHIHIKKHTVVTVRDQRIRQDLSMRITGSRRIRNFALGRGLIASNSKNWGLEKSGASSTMYAPLLL
jgi:hypothetical protein